MGKGRYLKAAERACTRKARFETGASAEAFAQGRYRAYRCVVCGGYHLTSGRGDRPEAPDPPKKEPPGPKLGDLDWSAVLDPQPRVRKAPPTPPPAPKRIVRELRCAGGCGKDGRVLLVAEGRLLKSRPVERALRAGLGEGVWVEASDEEPPRVLAIRPALG